MAFHIVTLFPESFDSYVSSSIIGRAVRNNKIKIKFYNPRNFVKPTKSQSKNQKPYLRVDNNPYGGGPGMVLEALPIIRAVESILKKIKSPSPKIILLSPNGKTFDNKYADKLSKKSTNVILICGRYEGVDARVKKILKAEEVSIGDYVVTGGELPAMVILDAVARRIDGVLGKLESVEENRISSSEVYTRPEIIKWEGKSYKVPKVLLSGNHKKIEEWRKGK